MSGMTRKRPFTVRLNFMNILMTAAIFVAMRLDSIRYLFSFGNLYYYLSLLVLFISICVFATNRKKKSPTIWLTLLLFGLYLLTSLYHRQSLMSAIGTIAAPTSIALITEIQMQRKSVEFLRMLRNLFVVLMLVDLLTILMFPKGMYTTELYQNNWFLGYKSARVRAVTVPVVAIEAILEFGERGKLSLNFILISALALLVTTLSGATMGMIAVGLEALIIFLLFANRTMRAQKRIMKLFNVKVIVIGIVVLNVLAAVTQSLFRNSLFIRIITETLDKSSTASGRLYIWSASVRQFLKSPLIGNGYMSGASFINLTGVRGGTQPHNLILALLVYTGIAGLAIYFIMLIDTIRRTETDVPQLSTICMVSVICNLFFGTTSMNMFGQFHYAMMIMLFYLSRMNLQKRGAIRENRQN